MKKKNIKTWLMGGVLALSFGALTTACGGAEVANNPVESNERYEVQDINYSYETGDNFSIEGAKLKIYNGNSFQTVNITNSMVRNMPDLTTVGEKQVEILYNNKIYKFTIYVSLNHVVKNQQYIDKLHGILEGLGNYRNSSVTGKIDFNLATNYLMQTNNFNQSYDYTVTAEDINNIPYAIAGEAYESIVKAILASCYDIDASHIVNADKNLSTYNYQTLIANVQQYVLTEQMLKVALSDVLPTQEQYASISEYLCTNLGITNQQGKDTMLTDVTAFFNELKELNYMGAVSPLMSFIENGVEYSAYPEAFVGARTIITEAVMVGMTGDYTNIISNALRSFIDEYISISVERGKTTKEYVDEGKPLIDNIINVIENIENAIFGKVGVYQTLTNLKDNLN